MTDQQSNPLNGTKTHPLTPHAWSILERLARGPVRAHEINPGVIDRLSRGDLTNAYADVDVCTRIVTITDAGRSALEARAA